VLHKLHLLCPTAYTLNKRVQQRLDIEIRALIQELE